MDLDYQGSSIREILISKLRKSSEYFKSLPHPYCESDCPWISFCRKFQFESCILSDLIEFELLSDYSNEEIVEEKKWY